MNILSDIALRIASDYVHKDDYTDADEEERYAMELAETVYDHFENHRLKTPVVDYTIKVSPKRYLKRDAKTDAQKKSYDVRIILMYVNEVEPSDIPCVEARRTWSDGVGSGEAITNTLDNLIVAINGSSEDDWVGDEEYFKGMLVHELMHILDHCAYEYYFNSYESHGRRTKHERKRNLEVSYPIGDDDCLDTKFAEYYTCENEMREYRSDLRTEIGRWCEEEDIDWNDAINEIKKAMDNEQSFRRFIEDWNGNSGAFITLYHLCFSKTSHGNRQTALKLLNGLQPLE